MKNENEQNIIEDDETEEVVCCCGSIASILKDGKWHCGQCSAEELPQGGESWEELDEEE